MNKKFISALVALMFLISVIIPAPVALAQMNDDLTDDQIQQIFDYVKIRFGSFSVSDLTNLSDIIDELDNSNQLVAKAFQELGTSDGLGERLNNLGITEGKVTDFDTYLRVWKNNYFDDLIEQFGNSDGDLDSDSVDAIKTLNTEFNNTFDTFNDVLHTKFNTKLDAFKMARKIFDDVLLDYVDISYINNNFNFTINDKDSFMDTINDVFTSFTLFKDNQTIAPITNSDVDNIQEILDSYEEVINTELGITQRNELKTYAEYLGFDVYTGSSGGGGTGGGGGAGGGGAGAGGGGVGGGTTSGEPNINPPAAPGESAVVTVPSGYLDVKVIDGQATVAFSDDSVTVILDLLAKAKDTYEGAPVVVTINLTSVGSDNIEFAIPQNLLKEVFAADASLRINLASNTILIPANAFDITNAESIKLTINIYNSSEAFNNINVGTSYDVLGNALNISISIDGKPVNTLSKKAEISFDLMGIVANTDKLGVYYVNKDDGTLNFVGGKVDKKNNVIKGLTNHFSTYVLAEYNKTFDDIQGHWGKPYIESMASKHVIGGRTERQFVPDDKITRAEFTKMIVLALGEDPVSYKGTFEDVAKDAWYADYVQAAYDSHIIEGKVTGKIFAPDELLSRQDMMTMIGRAISLTESPDTAYMVLNGYKDGNSVSNYAKGYVAALVGRGIVSGYEDDSLRPKANSTRAEVAKVIYGIYNY